MYPSLKQWSPRIAKGCYWAFRKSWSRRFQPKLSRSSLEHNRFVYQNERVHDPFPARAIPAFGLKTMLHSQRKLLPRSSGDRIARAVTLRLDAPCANGGNCEGQAIRQGALAEGNRTLKNLPKLFLALSSTDRNTAAPRNSCCLSSVEYFAERSILCVNSNPRTFKEAWIGCRIDLPRYRQLRDSLAAPQPVRPHRMTTFAEKCEAQPIANRTIFTAPGLNGKARSLPGFGRRFPARIRLARRRHLQRRPDRRFSSAG